MANPTKANQKFTMFGNTYTVKSFFGSTGVEYSTLKDCKANNKKGEKPCIKNTENEGAHLVKDCKLI